MNGGEKSDPTIVAIRTNAGGIRREKPANEPGRPGEERAEPRACPKRRLGVGAEGNARGPHGVRAQDRAASSSGIDRVREVAREKKGERFTTLLHHIDATLLRQAYHWLKRNAAPGVDGMTWDTYGEGLEARLRDLESRIHLGQRFVNASYNRRNAVLVPTGHSQACVPTFQSRTAGSGR
jgi:RNA-directed DNA polymerase